MGKRPWSSGIRSEGLATWKAPAAMNRMWSVFTGAVLGGDGGALDDRQEVALHALARDVRARAPPSRPAILSISSRKMMPACSDAPDGLRDRPRPCPSASRPPPGPGAAAPPRTRHAAALGAALGMMFDEHVLEVDADLLHALPGEDRSIGRPLRPASRARPPLVELAGAQLGRAASRAGARREASAASCCQRAAAEAARRAGAAAAARGAGPRPAPRRCSRTCRRHPRSCTMRRSPSSTRSRTIDSTSRPT